MSATIVELRELLATKYPQTPARLEAHYEFALSSLGSVSFPKAALTEVCGSAGATMLFLHVLFEAAHRQKFFTALIDGKGTFAPESFSQVSNLLWVICENAEQAIRSADLLVRDGNLSMIVLDLRLNPEQQLRRIAASSWHRFQRLLETTATTLVAVTPRPLVACASLRFQLHGRFQLSELSQRRNVLLEQLELAVLRERSSAPLWELRTA
ncbi:MAG: hypothetical protein QOD99_2959 [Chthoniobacter sp.]|jgi:hypothetical protein|nr:hypothetical protein [Chthoniobacter sp.]